MISTAVSEAQKRSCGLAFIHTHPGAARPPQLSAIDLRTSKRLATAFAELLDGPFASLVVSPAGWAGMAHNAGQLVPLKRIGLIGRRLEIYPHDADQSEDGRDDRQRRALGQSANSLLRRLRVGLVGVGGIGGPLAETLARMGVGALTLDRPRRARALQRAAGVRRDARGRGTPPPEGRRSCRRARAPGHRNRDPRRTGGCARTRCPAGAARLRRVVLGHRHPLQPCRA